jgi:2'-5' RNA ligase
VAERHRLLVALVLDGDVATEINGIRRALASSQLSRIAPHVTLVPPTNVAAENLADAERVVREAACNLAPFDAELGPPATFLDNRSVLYLRFQAPKPLESLRRALLAGPFAGRAANDRPFIPHVTLDSGPTRQVDERMLADLAGYVGTVRVEAVTLLEHHDAGNGRVWAPLTAYELDPARASGVGGVEVRLAHGKRLSPTLRSLAASWDAPLAPAGSDEQFVVASLGADVAGIATWDAESGVATLMSHVVAPSMRGLGVGTRLLSFVEHLEHERGRRALVVEATLADRAAAYYAGRGYRRDEVVQRAGNPVPLLRRLGQLSE